MLKGYSRASKNHYVVSNKRINDDDDLKDFHGKHVSTTKSGHHIYKSKDGFAAFNPKTRRIDMVVHGRIKKHPEHNNSTMSDLFLSGRKDSSLKAHDFYHHLITKHNIILKGDEQSKGGKKVWKKF